MARKKGSGVLLVCEADVILTSKPNDANIRKKNHWLVSLLNMDAEN